MGHRGSGGARASTHNVIHNTVLIPVCRNPVSRVAKRWDPLTSSYLMSSNYSSNRNRSRNGGGRRRPSGASDRPRGRYRSEDRAPREQQPAKKKGFLAKVLSFFGFGGGNKTSSPQQRAPRAEPAKGASPRPSRKPEQIEVTTPRVYVGNLSFDAAESDLHELFSGIGSVQNVEIVCNRETHRSKGFGFVQFASVEEAKRAVAELHDKEYMGRKLVVSGAKAVAESRSERSDRREVSSQTSEAEAAA